jgi:2'-hydroxyisoflavone reductase
MKLLVLGGTVFVGRHFVEAAVSRGHEVTIFHRGQRGAELFPDLDRVLGDRDGGLDALEGREFDAVVDCCGYVPRVVRQSVEAFRDRAKAYLFVSTISVYADGNPAGMDEGAELIRLEDPTVEEVTGETYGGLKVLCEEVVEEAFTGRSFIVRPGLIAGPYDPTNRFPYWVGRIAKGGEVLVPNRPTAPLQLIDARDLGLFMVLGLERGLTGTYNTAGPQMRFVDMIESCHRLNMGAQLVWADEAFLAEQGIQLWGDLPLALPSEGSDALMQVSSARAIAEGLTYRPLDQTTEDTGEWLRTEPPAGSPKYGLLTPEREAAALQAWKAQ